MISSKRETSCPTPRSASRAHASASSLGFSGLKESPCFPRNPNKRFRTEPTCYLNKFNAIRQAFHEGKKLASVSSKLENVVNSYYLRPVLLDHIKDLLTAEHALMGNLPVLKNSKGVPGKFLCPR